MKYTTRNQNSSLILSLVLCINICSCSYQVPAYDVSMN